MAIHHRLAVLRTQPRPLRFIASRLLMRSQLSRNIILERNGYRIRFHNSALPASLWVDPQQRIKEEQFLQFCLFQGDIVIDVGANIGTIALACAKAVGENGRVLAIEPHPRTYGRLVENVALNGHERLVVTTNVALGDQPGIVQLSDHSDDTQNAVVDGEDLGRVSVAVVPLDSIAPRGEVALVKLDAEGYEPKIVEGGRDVLGRTNMLYAEYDPILILRQGLEPEALLDELDRLGFALHLFSENGLEELAGPPASKCMIVALRAVKADGDRVRRAAAMCANGRAC